MREVILCKYGELILKGANRSEFEAKMMKELRQRAKPLGRFTVQYAQSTVFVIPEDEEAESNIDAMTEQAKHVFGFAGISRAAACEKNMDTILQVAKEYLPERMAGARTFKVEAKRSDKTFPLKSPEISGQVGGAILSVMPRLKVDVREPDVVVRVEVREREAYVHAGQEKGAGGMPSRTAGKGLLLLSGGIDSPVAGFMMAKRGVEIEAVHFDSFPYTSERAREKVFELAKIVTEYTSRMRIHVISLTHIQEEIRDHCDEDYFTLLLRRYMMALSLRVAHNFGCKALITGESLAQVASQTMDAIAVTDAMADMPVYRPLIGMDKEEIIAIARKIGTFDTSILPYEDCCTVFTPRHPRTRPELEKVLEQERKIDFDALCEEAWQTRRTVLVRPYTEPYYEDHKTQI